METGIGATLRETRIRRKIDLSMVEADTKIRLRYLRAIENEEWDALPGGAYRRGFIRTYASYLGLDGERLAEEYRRGTAPPGGERAPRVEPAATGRRGRGRPRLSGRVWVAAVSLALLGLLVGIGLSGDSNDGSPATGPAPGQGKASRERTRPDTVTAQAGVAVQLTAAAEVWVCLLDAAGEPLIEGQILAAGAEEGPFRSDRFTVAFGNGEVILRVDGEQAEIPPTSSPIGFAIDSGGGLRQLDEGERPTCT